MERFDRKMRKKLFFQQYFQRLDNVMPKEIGNIELVRGKILKISVLPKNTVQFIGYSVTLRVKWNAI